jgi:hypothetical protein
VGPDQEHPAAELFDDDKRNIEAWGSPGDRILIFSALADLASLRCPVCPQTNRSSPA